MAPTSCRVVVVIGELLAPREARGTHEEDEIEEEPDLLHHLAAVKLVVDRQRSKVVPHERDKDVDEVELRVWNEDGVDWRGWGELTSQVV